MTQRATESQLKASSLLKLMGPGNQGHMGPVGRSLSEYGMSSISAGKGNVSEIQTCKIAF